MPVLEAEDRPHQEVEHFGLAIQRTQLGLHTGVLYQLFDEDPRILHLADHHDLRDSAAKLPYRWAQSTIDSVNKVYLAELSARIAARKPKIAYGFNSDGISIDKETGDVIAGPPGRGLTCATFVVALLRAHGYEVVNMETWPERQDDAQFQDIIVNHLIESGHVEHAQAIKKDDPTLRLRPDELVGASTLPDDQWPISFDMAREAGDILQQEL